MLHTLPEPLSTYARVLVNEFLYEWRFLKEALAGRAVGRADFTDKLMGHFKTVIGVGVGKLPLPGTSVIEKGLCLAIDGKNDARKETKQEYIGRQQPIEEDSIRIIVELAAFEACKRYQYAILVQLSSDPLKGVIPLAKAGVERMLEYIGRNALPIAVPHLINGLFAGHSGAYASGFTNTKLSVLEEKQNESYLSKIKRKLGVNSYTAEGVYGLPALKTNQGKLFALGEKKFALHKIQKKPSDKIESGFNYGYTELIDKTCDPKYGYMQVNQAVVDQIYGHLKLLQPTLYHSLQQAPQKLSVSLQTQLNTFKQLIVTFNKLDLKRYITAAREAKLAKTPPISLFNFIKNSSTSHSDLHFLMYEPESVAEYDLSDLDLEGLILDDCSFTHCAFGGSLKKTSFQRCNLQFSDFKRVTTAEEINMSNAQCQFVKATKLNIKNSTLLQSDWSFANLSGSIIRGAQIIGVIWHHTNLDLIQSESQLGIIQANQEKIIKFLQTKLLALNSTFLEKQEEQNKLAAEVQALLAAEKTKNSKSNLTELMQALHQEKQDRLVQERDCKTELLRLQLKQTLQEETVDENTHQISELQTKSQQLEKLITLINTQQQEFDSCLSECRQLAKAVLSQEIKLNDLDQQVFRLDGRITDIISTQSKQFFSLNRRLSAVETALNKLTQERIDVETLSTDAKKRLRNRYQGHKEITGLFGRPFQLESQYINLQMVSQDKEEKKKQQEDKKKNSQSLDGRISSYEDLFGSKKIISPSDLFKTEDTASIKSPVSSSNFVLIQGRAGIGKSTFVAFASSEWAKGNLYSEYEWVFVLPLRELHSNTFKIFTEQKKSLTVWEWVYHVLFKKSGVSESHFNSIWLLKIEPDLHKNKVLFILDGFDEKPEDHPCKIALESLLEGEYASSPLLITSRPYGVGGLPKLRKDIEIIGFTDENIAKYIETYFYEEKESDIHYQIVTTLKTHPILWGIAHVPVNLNLICGIIDRGDQPSLALNNAFSQLHSMTTTYGIMESKLFERNYIERPNANHRLSESKNLRKKFLFEHYKEERNFLAKLAFLGMQNQQIILPHDYIDTLLIEMLDKSKFNEYEFLQSVRHLGLIKPIIDSSDLREEDQNYEFIHLTFQEYYTGIYISQSLINKDNELNGLVKPLIVKEKYNPRWQIVWWFVAGSLKEEPQALAMFFDLLQGHDTTFSKIALTNDLFQSYELGLLARCLDESESSPTANVTTVILPRMQLMIKNLYDLYIVIDKNESFFQQGLEMSPSLHRWQNDKDLYALCSSEAKKMSYETTLTEIKFANDINIVTPKISLLITSLLKIITQSLEKSTKIDFNFENDLSFLIQGKHLNEEHILLILEALVKYKANDTYSEIITLDSSSQEEKSDISSESGYDSDLASNTETELEEFLEKILCACTDYNFILKKLVELLSHESDNVCLFSINLINSILKDLNENEDQIYIDIKERAEFSKQARNKNFILNALKAFSPLFPKLINIENYDLKIAIVKLLTKYELINIIPDFIDTVIDLMEESANKKDFELITDVSESKKLSLNNKIIKKLVTLQQFQKNAPTHDLLDKLNKLLINGNTTERLRAISEIKSIGSAALIPDILKSLISLFYDEGEDADDPKSMKSIIFRDIILNYIKDVDNILPLLQKSTLNILSKKYNVKPISNLMLNYIEYHGEKVSIIAEMFFGMMDDDIEKPTLFFNLRNILDPILDELPKSFFEQIDTLSKVENFSNAVKIIERFCYFSHKKMNKPLILDACCYILYREECDDETNSLIFDIIIRMYDYHPENVITWIEKILRQKNKNGTHLALRIITSLGTTIYKPEILSALDALQLDENDRESMSKFIEQLGPFAAIPAVHRFVQTELNHNPKIDLFYLISLLGENAATPDIINLLMDLLKSPEKKFYGPACYLLRAFKMDVLNLEWHNKIAEAPQRNRLFAAGLIGELNISSKDLSPKEITRASYSSLNHIYQALTDIYNKEKNTPQKIFLLRTLIKADKLNSSDIFFPIVVRLLGDSNEYVRETAADALLTLKYEKDELFKQLIIVLVAHENFYYWQRELAYIFICKFIKKIKVEGIPQDLVDYLIHILLHSSTPRVSKAVAEVLKDVMMYNQELLIHNLLDLLNTKISDYIVEIFIDFFEKKKEFLADEILIRMVEDDELPIAYNLDKLGVLDYDMESTRVPSGAMKIIKNLKSERFTFGLFNVLTIKAQGSFRGHIHGFLAQSPGLIEALPDLLLSDNREIKVEIAEYFNFIDSAQITLPIIKKLHASKNLNYLNYNNIINNLKNNAECMNFLIKVINSSIDFWPGSLSNEIIKNIGPDAVSTTIFKLLLNDYHHYFDTIRTLIEHSLVRLFRMQFIDGAGNLKEWIGVAAILFFGAYYNGSITSCNIKWNEKNYDIHIFSDKESCLFPLTLMQAQVLRRTIPQVIFQAEQHCQLMIANECIEKKSIHKGLNIEKLIQQSKEWPSIETDPFLADSRPPKQSLISSVSLEEKSNPQNNKIFSWDTTFTELQSNINLRPLFEPNLILTLERKKKEVFLRMTSVSDIVREKLILLGETLSDSVNHLITDWDFEESCLSLKFKISDYAIAFYNFVQSQSSGLHIKKLSETTAQEQKNVAAHATQYPFWAKKTDSLSTTQPSIPLENNETTNLGIQETYSMGSS